MMIILITAVLGFATLMVGFFVSDGSGWLVFGCVNIILLIVCVRSILRSNRQDLKFQEDQKEIWLSLNRKTGESLEDAVERYIEFSAFDIYEGEFKDAKRHGQGTHTNKSGEKYEGEFKDGLYDGQGTLTFPSITDNPDIYRYQYVGEFKDGKRHGHGITTSAHFGSSGEGEWRNGKRNGQGTETESDGSKYIGEYKDNNPWNGKEFDSKGEIINLIENGIKNSIEEIKRQK